MRRGRCRSLTAAKNRRKNCTRIGAALTTTKNFKVKLNLVGKGGERYDVSPSCENF